LFLPRMVKKRVQPGKDHTMKILSEKHGFTSDHSSTSYQFLAIDKPLGKDARADVAALSDRAIVKTRRAGFHFPGEWSDLPVEWRGLMVSYFDVMYRESYSWWTLAIAFNAAPEQILELKQYAFDGTDDLGTSVSQSSNRAIVTIECIVDGYCPRNLPDDGDALDRPTTDGLLNLLMRIRRQLIARDYRALYAIWEIYARDPGKAHPPVPPAHKNGQSTIELLRSILGRI